MQRDSLDPEWSALLRRWRRADERIRVPDAPVVEIIAVQHSGRGLRTAPEWLGVAAVLAIAVMFPFGIRHLNDVPEAAPRLSVVPTLASESPAEGPCGSFMSCLSHVALLERIEPD